MAALNAVPIKVTEPYWFNNLGYIAISTAELIIAVYSNYSHPAFELLPAYKEETRG